MKPYTYLIGWSWLDLWYYGVRFKPGCDPNDLWKTYFTSSKKVKKMRGFWGEPDIIEIRRTFPNEQKARYWENTVLRRMKVTEDLKWLNDTDNKAISYEKGIEGSRKAMLYVRGREKTPEHRMKIAQRLKGVKHTEERKQKMRLNRPHGPSNKRWITNGIIETYKIIEQLETGWKFGRLNGQRYVQYLPQGRQK